MTEAEIWLGTLTVLVLVAMADVWARQRRSTGRGTATARALARKTAEVVDLRERLASVQAAPAPAAEPPVVPPVEYGDHLAYIHKLEAEHLAATDLLRKRLAATQRQLDDATGVNTYAVEAGRALLGFGGGR